ncbi:MAG: DNA-directed RNA polymerase subunit omega [Bacteroidota bacterium]|nr:DNA-directed RNA polymerase subunit omega [Bacteroidota bacterium]
MTLQPLELKELDKHTTNIYEAIVILSKRARQINEEMKIRLNQELEMFTSRIDTDEEIETNPEQMQISIAFEKMPKPTQQAVEDLLNNRLRHEYKEE